MLTHVFKPRWVVLILVSGCVARGEGGEHRRGGGEVSRGWNTEQGMILPLQSSLVLYQEKLYKLNIILQNIFFKFKKYVSFQLNPYNRKKELCFYDHLPAVCVCVRVSNHTSFGFKTS